MKAYKYAVYIFISVLIIFIAYHLIKYANFYYKIHNAYPYILPSYVPSPVLEEDLKSVTWIIHKYVPLHNAGSEWMAHAMNKYFINSMGFHANVIVNTSPVNEFERVFISEKNDIHKNELFVKHSSVLISHHTQQPNAVQTALVAKRPLVLVMHDDGQKEFLQEFIRILPKNLYLICNSKWLQEYYSVFSIPSIVLYPPVYWKEYAVTTTREYVTLINLNKNKGGDVLIQIASQMPDIKFLGVKGSYNKQIMNKYLTNITYEDNTPYINDIYGKTDILLMPSYEESWGRTAIEAMSSGIPVIASPTPGLLESCGNAGIFCQRNNINAWIHEIRKLKNNKEYYNEQSAKCLARAKELEPDKQLEKIGNWLQELKWKA